MVGPQFDVDKTGLPDPIILASYFKLVDNKIAELIVILSMVSHPGKPEPGRPLTSYWSA